MGGLYCSNASFGLGLLCLLVLGSVAWADGNSTSSGAPCDIVVEVAQYFNVTKIPDSESTVVLNKYNKQAYVLTPESGEGSPTEDQLASLVPEDYNMTYVTTPIKNVTATETTSITYLGLLGERGAISSFSPYTTSSCLLKMQEDGLASPYDANGAPANGGTTLVGYTSTMTGPGIIQTAVSAEQINGSMLATSEWIKFFAPFFGPEAECLANDIFEGIKERYDCHKEKVAQVSRDLDPVKVAVVQKNFGYDCGGCEYETDPYFGVSDAGYWKDYIKVAGATPIVETPAFDGLTPDGTMYKFTNATAFHAILEEADVVIDSTYLQNATAESLLEAYDIPEADKSNYKFVQDEALWRHDRRVSPTDGDDWFEGRYPEADVLLEDIIFALHPQYSGLILNPKHELTWMRNMYTSPGQEILTADMCSNVDAPAQIIADSCESLSVN